MITTFLMWFFATWLFPLLPLWILISLMGGTMASIDPLEWDVEVRMWLSVWTVVVWGIGVFILLCMILPGR